MVKKMFYSKDEVKEWECVNIPFLVTQLGIGAQILNTQNPMGFKGVVGEVYFIFPAGCFTVAAGHNIGMNLSIFEGNKEAGRMFDQRRGITSVPATWMNDYIWASDCILNIWWGRTIEKNAFLQAMLIARIIATQVGVQVIAKVYVMPENK